MIKIFCSILLFYFCVGTVSSQKIVGCYWGAWTSINQIDISLCTHAYFAFYIPDSNGAISTDSKLVSSFLALKTKNPSVKLLASIGGWNAGTASFSAIASNPTTKSKFVSNCVALTAKGFDGIDIDWEFPGTNDKQSFVNLLAVLKSALNAKGKILAAAVNSGAWQISQSYNIADVCRYLDLVNLMTYDFQWPYTTTGTNAGYSQTDSSAAIWISGGCSSSKLVLGLASYGYDYTLINPSRNGVGVSASGATSISYRDICQKLKSSGWTTKRSDQTPYSYKGTEWISYDDVTSLKAKLSIVSTRGLAGAFFWSTNLDDFDNSCKTGSFPLILSVSKALGVSSGGSVSQQTTTPKTANPTTKSPATTKPPKFVCTVDGFFAYPGDCTKFYRCVSGTAYTFACPSGLGWNQVIKACDYKTNILGCV